METSDRPTCPVCGHDEATPVLSLQGLPVLINAQVRPSEARDVVRGDMELVACVRCAHLHNEAFDAGLLDYDATYENSLHFSGRFREFALGLCDRLVTEHALVGAEVAELGSGPGHFLSMMCDAGVARGLGFDPSYDRSRLGAPDHPSVTISTELFPSDGSLEVAFSFSQHVLEHLDDPVAALRALRRAVSTAGGAVYSEVPNGALMVRDCALWDLIYEHRSYFVPTSLDLACRLAGLRSTRTDTAFDAQFLWCEAVPDDEVTTTVDAVRVAAAVEASVDFGAAARARIVDAARELGELREIGPVALWGAGSKGATYLNLVADPGAIAAVVDINPRKAGWGVPGTEFAVTGPEDLVQVDPATVLVANPAYVDEISATLAALGLHPTITPLWG